MCKECGCSIPEHNPSHHHHHHPELNDRKTIEVIRKILDANDRQAESNRRHFEEYGILAVNLMSSPGAGKTSLIEKTIEILGDEIKIGVIEGDLETNNDAERIRKKGAPAYQITTGQACHLDAFMVHEGIHNLPLEDLNLVFIENVGNLVCPASYDVGAHTNVVLLSVTEGEDKPEKYPVIFKDAELMVITKIDLLPYLDFDLGKAIDSAKRVNPDIKVIKLSVKTGDGLEGWVNFLKEKLKVRT